MAHLIVGAGHVQPLFSFRQFRPDFSRAYRDATHPFRNPEHIRLLVSGLQRAGWSG